MRIKSQILDLFNYKKACIILFPAVLFIVYSLLEYETYNDDHYRMHANPSPFSVDITHQVEQEIIENERFERISNALKHLIQQGERSLSTEPESYFMMTKEQDAKKDENKLVEWQSDMHCKNQEKLIMAIQSLNEMAKARAMTLSNKKKNKLLLRDDNMDQKNFFFDNNISHKPWNIITNNITTNTIGMIFITMVISAHSAYTCSQNLLVFPYSTASLY
ncbi:hypothetical protein K501DRAFT_275451 [Backusella circina FSU 941]|nr:hypothetical protein K501DRAFT_275451 [Backusella circina FSU 941]